MQSDRNTVFITGGSSGIGLALARGFLDLQNTVIICGRDQRKLDAVKKQLPEIVTIRCDVTHADDVRRTVATLCETFPQLNVLVNNAGVQHRYDFCASEDVPARIDEEIAVNLTAVMRLTHLLLPVLVRQPGAAIVNVSSLLGYIPKKSAPVYCATKAGVHAFSKSLRYQLADTSVKVFEVVPPLVDTGMTEGQVAPKISPQALAQEALRGLQRDRYEIRVGQTKGLLALNRFFPALVGSTVGNK